MNPSFKNHGRKLYRDYGEEFVVYLIGSNLFGSTKLLKFFRNIVYRMVFGIKMMTSIDNHVLVKTRSLNSTGNIQVGTNVSIGSGVLLDAEGTLIIGNNVTISRESMIYTHSHNIKDYRMSDNVIEYSKLIIEDDAWIGARSIILPSVNVIGKGAVVGAGSIVNKDVEPFSIVAGNTARVIAYRNIRF